MFGDWFGYIAVSLLFLAIGYEMGWRDRAAVLDRPRRVVKRGAVVVSSRGVRCED